MKTITLTLSILAVVLSIWSLSRNNNKRLELIEDQSAHIYERTQTNRAMIDTLAVKTFEAINIVNDKIR